MDGSCPPPPLLSVRAVAMPQTSCQLVLQPPLPPHCHFRVATMPTAKPRQRPLGGCLAVWPQRERALASPLPLPPPPPPRTHTQSATTLSLLMILPPPPHTPESSTITPALCRSNATAGRNAAASANITTSGGIGDTSATGNVAAQVGSLLQHERGHGGS